MNFLLKDIKTRLVNLGYIADEIVLQTIGHQTSTNTSLQSAIFIIEESSMPTVSNIQYSDIAIFIRRPDPETANTVAQDIFYKLHGRRGNVGTVDTNHLKINLIQALSKPFAYSTTTTGSNMTEYVIKFRIQYIDTQFNNL